MTTYLESELNQMLDEVAYLAEDYPTCLDMVSEADKPENKEILFEYLRLLVPRLRQMQRKINQVKAQDNGWVIENFSFDIYKWYIKRQIDGVVTPHKIVIPPGWLSQKEQEQFLEMSKK